MHRYRRAALPLGALLLAAPLVAVAAPAYAADSDVVINEVESNGDATDWIEVVNTGSSDVEISGWIVKDSDDTRALTFPSGTVLAPGAFATIDTNVDSVTGNFGLGGADEARLFLADGTTLISETAWTAHAATTWGRQADGAFAETSESTRSAANVFAPAADLPAVLINEVASTGALDFIELVNTNQNDEVDLSGYILRDQDADPYITLPAGTTIESGGYLAVPSEPTFGLGSPDEARLFAPDGVTLVDGFAWTSHASTSYGLCPDVTGEFVVTASATPGLINDCAPLEEETPLETSAWPGPAEVVTVDDEGQFVEDLSGVAYEEALGNLWAVENGTGVVSRLEAEGSQWRVQDQWTLRYPDDTGIPDSEGIEFTDAGSAGLLYVATERNDEAGGTSRPSVLSYDLSAEPGDVAAEIEWNLTSALPAGLGANGGLEGIAFIPDADLVAGGLTDSTGTAYDPADYPLHGDGLFFVGVETDGNVYAFALNSDGSFDLVTSFDSPFELVADLEYDTVGGVLWVVCDEVCEGQIAIFELADSGAFEQQVIFDRPADMPNAANEGFALGESCTDGLRTVFWADDADTDGHSIRSGAIYCGTVEPDPTTPPVVELPGIADDAIDTEQAAPAERDRLANTGTDGAGMIASIALALLAAGAGLVLMRRRARA
jgi:LPXTG-motif cell wall-anchored protein